MFGSLASVLTANLTSYQRVELWITRTSLLLALAVIGPTLVLICLDILLWCFRFGQGPALIERSKSGIDLLQKRARRLSFTSASPAADKGTSSFHMTKGDKADSSPTTDSAHTTHAKDHQEGADKPLTMGATSSHRATGTTNHDLKERSTSLTSTIRPQDSVDTQHDSVSSPKEASDVAGSSLRPDASSINSGNGTVSSHQVTINSSTAIQELNLGKVIG